MGLLLGSLSVSLIYVFLFLVIPHGLEYCSYIIHLEIACRDSSILILLFQNFVRCYSTFILYSCNLKMTLLISIKYVARIYLRIMLNLYINVGRIYIFFLFFPEVIRKLLFIYFLKIYFIDYAITVVLLPPFTPLHPAHPIPPTVPPL